MENVMVIQYDRQQNKLVIRSKVLRNPSWASSLFSPLLVISGTESKPKPIIRLMTLNISDTSEL